MIDDLKTKANNLQTLGRSSEGRKEESSSKQTVEVAEKARLTSLISFHVKENSVLGSV